VGLAATHRIDAGTHGLTGFAHRLDLVALALELGYMGAHSTEAQCAAGARLVVEQVSDALDGEVLVIHELL